MMGCVLRRFFLLFLTVTALTAGAAPAHANSKYSALVMHAHSGDVLFSRHANSKRYPASLTKMMTLYVLFDEIEAGRLSLDSQLKVSKNAAGQPPSKLGVRYGKTISVETAINALVVKSANDVAVVVAEAISGSEWRFAQKMTQKARQLGMTRTTFRNASGLPNSRQLTTAKDMATLGQSLMRDHPDFWKYFATKSFTYNGRTYRTHNALVRSYKGADGLKTGYTRRSGYNLATTAKRDGNHLIGVVLGGRSTRTRDAHMRLILDNSFARISKKPQLIAALHRKRPAPRMKPTLMASLAEQNAAPTISANAALKSEIALAAASLSADANDPISALISANADSTTTSSDLNGDQLEKLHRLAMADQQEPQGDIDPALIWSIQIGAYSDIDLAHKELEAAAIAAELTDRTRVVSPPRAEDKRPLYRARFTRLSESEAEEICSDLRARHINCFSIKEPRS